MTQHDDFDRVFSAWLDERAPGREPDGLLETILTRTHRTRRRPDLTFPERWLPMRLSASHPFAAVARLAWLLLVLAVIIALAVVALGSGGQRRLPSPFGPATPGLITFEANGQVLLADPDGNHARPLLAGSSPIWSRDGLRIGFWVPSGGSASPTASLYVANADGTNRQELVADAPDPGACLGPGLEWSPDASQIAYAAMLNGTPRVFVVATSGGTATPIGDPNLAAVSPAWSPDGTRITFKGGTSASDEGLYVMVADGSHPTRLTARATAGHPCAFESAQWAPDGSRLLFSAGDTDRRQIWVENADGTDERAVGGDNPEQWWPVWSPDGARIAFDRRNLSTAAYATLVIARPDGSQAITPAGADRCSGEPPIWSPDGRTVFCFGFDTSSSTLTGLILLDPAGQKPAVTIPIAGTSGQASYQRLP